MSSDAHQSRKPFEEELALFLLDTYKQANPDDRREWAGLAPWLRLIEDQGQAAQPSLMIKALDTIAEGLDIFMAALGGPVTGNHLVDRKKRGIDRLTGDESEHHRWLLSAIVGAIAAIRDGQFCPDGDDNDSPFNQAGNYGKIIARLPQWLQDDYIKIMRLAELIQELDLGREGSLETV